MKQKFLSLLLAAVLAVTSVDMTVFATEKENEEAVCTQVMDMETDDAVEQTEQINHTEAADEIEVVEDMQLLEDVVTEEIKTMDDAQKEVFSESIDDKEDAVNVATEVWEDYVETEKTKETVKLLEDVGENSIDVSDEETKEQALKIENRSFEEVQTEEVETADGTEISEEMETADEDLTYTRISRVSRDDGTWLFPLDSKWWNSFSDWAGCTVGKCSLCGKTHSCAVPTHKNHNGVDIGVPIGTSVRAAASGKVAYTGYDNDRGNFVVIEHQINGTNFSYYSYYQHLNTISVAKGANVKAGDVIAKSGKTGYGSGAHLHFGIVMAEKGTNIGSRLGTVEGKGWIRDSGYKEGGILANPSTKQQTMPTGPSCYCEENLYLHCGSVTYTFDKSKVTVGSGSGAVSTLQITGQTPPGNGNINAGAYWTCNGTIKSNYSINEVSGYILASDNSTVLYSKTINPNASSYSLANGAIDKALLFNKLSAGTYYYKITAKDTSGKTISYNVKFTVTDPAPVPCNFSGQITSPAYDAVIKEPIVNIQASVTDTYAINNFIIKLYWNGQTKTETAPASISGNTYVCNYNMSLPEQAWYGVEVYAACANGATHRIPGDMAFVYDVTPPVISDILIAVTEDGEFFFDAKARDELTGDISLEPNPQFKKWIIVTDETRKEKKFECGVGFGFSGFSGYWTDISGLESCGRYTITFYAQDGAGNIGYEIVKDIIMSEVSSAPKRVDLTVGEEKDVDFSVVSLFNFEEKALSASNDILQVTDKGLKASGGGQNRVGSKIYEMKASAKGVKPGSSIIRTDWKAKNNVVTEGQSYSVYAYVVPQAPKITKISNKLEGCDVITYEPVQYAKTYELYRKRIGIDADYIPYEEFSDNKSHSIVVEHADKNVVYYYRLCAKAEEAIDIRTNEKYYPTSVFSNDMHSVEQSETEESSSIEESSVSEESAAEEESTSEDASLPEEGDITDGLYISGLQTKTYTGSAIKQDIQVYYNQILLKEGRDYTLSYKNNTNAGKALLTIKAKGNLTGSVTKSFEIKPREITDKDVIIEDTVYIHDSKPHKKAPRVIYKGKTLKEKKDFEVSSYGKGNYTSEGTYTATIKGIGNFKGSCSTAKIIIVDKSKDISKATLEKIPVQEYQNGKAIELPDKLIKVTIAKTMLKKDIDYTVSYANNVHAGKATLIIKGKGDYAGTKKVNFTIKRTPTALTSSMITNKSKINTVSIQKNGAMPKPVLKSDNNTLMEGRDYVLSYKNNKKTGTGTAVIKGKGSYTGTIEMSFKITSKVLTNSDISIRVPNVPYIGKPNKYQSIPVLTDSDGGVLVKNKDYIIESYKEGKKALDKSSNPEEGAKITVTIKGMGNYTGTVQASYALEGISFSKAVIKVKPKAYTGKTVTIDAADITSATIKTGKKQIPLKFGKDFEIAAYSNNLKKGTATVTFRGIGAYAGEKTIKFKITPTAISSKNG